MDVDISPNISWILILPKLQELRLIFRYFVRKFDHFFLLEVDLKMRVDLVVVFDKFHTQGSFNVSFRFFPSVLHILTLQGCVLQWLTVV